MNTPIQEEERSNKRGKIIAIAITILTLVGIAVWQGLLLALRLTS